MKEYEFRATTAAVPGPAYGPDTCQTNVAYENKASDPCAGGPVGPVDPKFLLLQRMKGHETYLMNRVRQLNDLAQVLNCSRALPTYAQQAIVCFVDAALAHI